MISINKQENLLDYVEDKIDLSSFINQYKIDLENRILKKESATKYSDATFESDLWILFHDTSQTSRHIDFIELRDLERFNKILKEDIDILKCYIADELIDGRDESSVAIKYSNIAKFIIETNNFNWETVNSKKGNSIDTLFSKLVNSNKVSMYNSILNYLEYIEQNGLLSEDQAKIASYISENSYAKGYTSGKRKLPSNKEIFKFDFIIRDFFNSSSQEELDCLLRKIYKPLLIWWKITNIIPLRPVEICGKIPRECIYTKEDRYYLKINRAKVNLENRKVSVNHNSARIPLLKELEITKEIYYLIQEYIKETNFDKESKTLFSYKALVQFRRDYMSIKNNEEDDPLIFFMGEIKYDKNRFSTNSMKNLLYSFRKCIINQKYKTSFDKDINLGDTRHLAFASLVFQGINPIDIAMLGGHTSLKTQDQYVGHARYYIDSEIADFVTGRKLIKEDQYSSLAKKIKKDTKWTPPRPLIDCYKTEDGVGYCTANRKKGDKCDKVILCPYCSKWWCEPTNESFINIRKYIEEKHISPLMKLIDQQEKFLHKLITEAEVVNINGLLELEINDSEVIRETALKIRKNADRLLYFKKSLIEMKDKSLLK